MERAGIRKEVIIMLLLCLCRVCSAVLLEAGDTIGVGVAVEGLTLEGRRWMEMWGDGLGPPSEVEGLQAWREGGGGSGIAAVAAPTPRSPRKGRGAFWAWRCRAIRLGGRWWVSWSVEKELRYPVL